MREETSTTPTADRAPLLSAVRHTYRADPEVVSTVRHDLMDALARLSMDHLSDPAALLVSELFTNAMRHASVGDGFLSVNAHLARGGSAVRVQVCDPDADTIDAVKPCQADLDDTGGRGLALVDMIADAWGVKGLLSGKCVWFELGGTR